MRRIVAVPPGARLSRRSNSWRGGSAAMLSCARLAADCSAAYAFDAASTCAGSGEKPLLALLVQFPVQIPSDFCQRDAGGLSPLGQQLLAADDEAPQLESVGRDGHGPFLNRFEHRYPIGGGKYSVNKV